MRKTGLAVLAALTTAGGAWGQGGLDPQSLLPPMQAWSGASEALVAAPGSEWITPAEAAGFETTPSYDATLHWLRRLDEASEVIRMETFGMTPEGRPLVAVIAEGPSAAAAAGRPVVLAQAAIHAGEIDGKDAGLMLLRDLAFGPRQDLLSEVTFVFIPMINPDGHERASAYNRPNQRGPANQGWRHNALNLNLNRDYMKADAPEMRALLGLIGRYDPALYIDLHVTDGMDHQFDITFTFDGWDGRYADSPAIGRWLDERLRPGLERALNAAGHVPGPYIEARNPADPAAGITQSAYAPRFSHAYGDLRRMPTMLVENHSLKPYRQRVLGTYVLLEEALRRVGQETSALRMAIIADRALRPSEVIASWRPVREPAGTFRFLPMESRTYRSEAAGGEVTTWTGRPAPAVNAPIYVYEPALRLPVAKAYWVPGSRPDLIERLAAHGVRMERLEFGRLVSVDMIRIVGFTAAAPTEGRFPVTGEGFSHEARAEWFGPGSVRISTDQPLGALVAALLEPEGPDSFFAWGFFPEMLQRVEYMEAYAIAPLADAMLTDPGVRAAFEAALAADPAMAANSRARLQWFYRRSPFYDQRYLLYPVGREPG